LPADKIANLAHNNRSLICAEKAEAGTVKKGLINVHRYYVPLHRVEGWEGKVVWLKIPEEMVKTNYERDPAPDPHNYHYSSAPMVDASDNVRRFQINIPKIPPRAQEERPFLVSHESTRHQERVLVCNLCNATFKSDDELSSHVESSH
jgi:hypothetical protein